MIGLSITDGVSARGVRWPDDDATPAEAETDGTPAMKTQTEQRRDLFARAVSRENTRTEDFKRGHSSARRVGEIGGQVSTRTGARRRIGAVGGDCEGYDGGSRRLQARTSLSPQAPVNADVHP